MNEPDELCPPHECRLVARIHNMDAGRDWWLGELTEPAPGWPQETHCLHITTPLKKFVLLVNRADMQGLAVLAQIVSGQTIARSWLDRMELYYRKHPAEDRT